MRRLRKPSFYLYPVNTKIKRREIATYDIESKEGTTQKPGMTRPFLAAIYDGKKVALFRDTVPFKNKSIQARHGWRWEHLHPKKGCIDKLCRRMFSEAYNGRAFYAHNGGNFDHLFILPWLTSHRHLGYDFTVIPVQSTVQQVTVTQKRNGRTLKWTLLDSLRLLPMSLQRATQTFGLTGKDDLDLGTHEDDPRWEEYNARDCMALYEVMQRVTTLVEEKLGGEVGITAPASSMKLFRRKYQKDRITRHAHFADCPAQGDELLCDGCCHNWIRRSYVGGRTELFEMLGGQCQLCGGEMDAEGEVLTADCPRCQGSGVDPEHFLRYYDINSSYVAALCEPMPVGERIVEEGRIDWGWRERGYVGFAECQVFIPEECEIPPLPKKHRDSGKLVFPKGKFEGIWDMEELALLEHPRVRGKVTWVGRVVWFKAEPIFKQMMLELYRLRDKSIENFDEGLSALAKLFGNGLYGKFAMALLREEIVFRKDNGRGRCFLCDEELTHENVPEDDSCLCEGCTGSKVAGNDPETDVWYRAKKVAPAYVIPQISAHVTSLARVRLWKFMVEAIERGGRIFMTDTDSIITNVELPNSSELGDLKDEYPNEPLRFLGVQPKVYLLEKAKPFKGEHKSSCTKKQRCECKLSTCTKCHGCLRSKVTFKGVPKSHRTKENLVFMVQGGEARYERLEKIRGMAGREFRGPPKMIEVKRRIIGRYEKRIVHQDGRTSPLRFPLTITPEEQAMLERVVAEEPEE